MALTSSNSARKPSSIGLAWAVLAKDLRVEFRTRLALAAIGLFALTTLVAVSFAVGQKADAEVQASLLWVVIYFAAQSGLTRSFVAEEEGRTADALRLAADGLSVFGGKLAFNLLLLTVLAIVLVPGFALLLGLHVVRAGLLAATLAAGCCGLAVILTFTAALVAGARSRGALATVISFPLAAPLLKLAISASVPALDGTTGGWPELRALVALGGIVAVVAWLLFDLVWES